MINSRLKYPFTSKSSLKITDGVVLPDGLFYGARLLLIKPAWPVTINKLAILKNTYLTALLYLTDSVGTDHGCIRFSTEPTCPEFDNTVDTTFKTGYLFEKDGYYSGCLRSTGDFLNTVTMLNAGDYILNDDAFIFVPGAVFCRDSLGFTGMQQASCTITDPAVECSDTSLHINTQKHSIPLTENMASTPIKMINGVGVSGSPGASNIAIINTPESGIKVITEGGGIWIGKAEDI